MKKKDKKTQNIKKKIIYKTNFSKFTGLYYFLSYLIVIIVLKLHLILV